MKAHGTFFWNELMTWSVDKAKDFYGETLGWQYESHPMADGRHLHALQGRRGHVRRHLRDEAGARASTACRTTGSPYIAVDDIDARLAGVEAAGGEIMRPAFDVPDVGRFAVVKDSAGAFIGWVTPDECD